jgi:uncharacterized protein (TIGR04255 family)
MKGLKMNLLPKKLETDLILSAIFELRFSSKIPSEAIFGMCYQVVAKKYPGVGAVRLPITQLPDVVRDSDPNLMYQPHHHLDIDGRGVGIGPKSIQFSVQKPYIGWLKWSNFILELLPDFIKLDIFENIERTGLRYLNFTEKNLSATAKMNISIGSVTITHQPMTFRAEIQEKDHTVVLNLINNAIVEVPPSNRLLGSVIDIDVFKEVNTSATTFQGNAEEILNRSHEIEKKLFFEMLQPDFIATLGPSY